MKLAFGLTAAVIVTLPGTQTQDRQNGQDRTPAPRNAFLDAWMTELLLGDRIGARDQYRALADRKDLPNGQSELAILRLWESTWLASDRASYNRELESRGKVMATSRTFDSDTFESFALAFAEAHANNDAPRLAELRQQVATQVRANPFFRSRRRLVDRALTDRMFLDPVGPDPRLEELKQKLETARANGDTRASARLRAEIVRRTSPQRRQNQVRLFSLLRKRWADIARLHLEREHRRAEAGESTFGGRDRQWRRLVPYREFVAELGLTSWDDETRRKRLDGVIERLAEGSRMLRYSVDAERSVLRELRTRLTQLRSANQIEQALRLAARVPYRQELFFVRRR